MRRNPKVDPQPGDIVVCSVHGEVRVQDMMEDAVYVYWPEAGRRCRMTASEWREYWSPVLGMSPDVVLARGR